MDTRKAMGAQLCSSQENRKKQARRNSAVLAQRSQVLQAFSVWDGRTKHSHSLFFTKYMREKEMYLHKVNPTRDQLSRVKVSHHPMEAGPYLPVPAEQGLMQGQAPVPPPPPAGRCVWRSISIITPAAPRPREGAGVKESPTVV